MSEWTKLTAQDGHELKAYIAKPEGAAVGAVVVVQEIFGVNPHIRSVADKFAKEGYVAIAPSLFDRIAPGIELKYDGDDGKKGFELMGKLTPETSLMDIGAAFEWAKEQHKGVAVVGFCYGGLMSWLSATRGEVVKMQPACCVGYYAGGIGKVAAEEPSCPVMLHFGGADSHIGMDQVDAVRSAHPEVQVFVYDGAGHAFNRDVGASYDPEAAKLAWSRTMEFLKTNVA
jgi:carboxymethylenebutenolidase